MITIIILVLLFVGFIALYNSTDCEAFAYLAGIMFLCLVIALIAGGEFAYRKYVGTQVVVMDGEEELYKGNSAFYDIQSMGTATYFVEKEQRVWFPRVLNERVSNNIKVTRVEKK